MLKKIQYFIFPIALGLGLIYVLITYNPFYSIDKFGLDYNEFREKNNIPLLPSDWVLDTIGKHGIDNFHNPDINKIGHRIKYINVRKGKIGAESDQFYLTQDSIIISRYERKSGNKLLYLRLNPSFDKKLISHKEANDLLEKYSIDFRFNESWSVNVEL